MSGIWTEERREDMRQRTIARNKVHGLSRHRFYPMWRDMMNRCRSPNNKFYKDYGGRGIMVCPEWLNALRFIEWAESQPFIDGMSLDRFPDVGGPYSPENCRFATSAQQNRNMRSNVWVEHNGERLIFKDFALKYGVVSYECAKSRVRHGADPIKAVLTQKGKWK